MMLNINDNIVIANTCVEPSFRGRSSKILAIQEPQGDYFSKGKQIKSEYAFLCNNLPCYGGKMTTAWLLESEIVLLGDIN